MRGVVNSAMLGVAARTWAGEKEGGVAGGEEMVLDPQCAGEGRVRGDVGAEGSRLRETSVAAQNAGVRAVEETKVLRE